MRVRPSKPWFVRRNIGLGWRPASWQAWSLAAALVLVSVVAVVAFKSSGIRFAVILGAAALYTVVAAITSATRPDVQESSDADRPVPEDEPAGETRLRGSIR